MAAAATAATSSTPSFETSSPSTSMNPVVIDDDILLAARVLFNTHLLFLQNVLSNRYDSPPPCDEDDNHSYTLPSPSPPPLLAVSTKKHGSDDPNKRKRKPPKRYEAEEDFEFNEATYIMPLRELLPVVHLLNAKSPEPPVATRKPRGPPKPRAMPSPSPKPVVKRRKLDDSANSSGTSSPTPRKANSSRRCTYCFATTTPMWRHGPPGYPDLCNKCGVKWMRGKILQDINKSEVSSEPEER